MRHFDYTELQNKTWDNEAITTSPCYGNGIIALDAWDPLSGMVNCIVIVD